MDIRCEMLSELNENRHAISNGPKNAQTVSAVPKINPNPPIEPLLFGLDKLMQYSKMPRKLFIIQNNLFGSFGRIALGMLVDWID